jgi:uncharacterized protein (DUF1800 family)
MPTILQPTTDLQPTRRAFLKGSSASVLSAAFLPAVSLPPAFAAAPSNTILRKALNRLTFGATRQSIAAVEELGFPAWLDRQLSAFSKDEYLNDILNTAYIPIEYEAGKDENGNEWKALEEPKRPLNHLKNYALADFVPLANFSKSFNYIERERPAREVQLASLIGAVHSDNQLSEVIVQFWHEHFSVNSVKDAQCATYFVLHDRLIRDEALGNFRKLLGNTAKSPAMLAYLNNAESRASPANENYARELFELHTMGEAGYANGSYEKWSDVPGAKEGMAEYYLDQDVYEAARAFTGWTIGDGSELGEGDILPLTGEMTYYQTWHDPYQKRILGVEFKANAAPMSDGETVLDILSKHPATAKTIALKLTRRLLADEPDETLVAEVAAAFLALTDDPDQIGKLVKLIALSPQFAAQEPTKMKRPMEFLVSLYRATGARVRTTGNAFYHLQHAGWRQHEWRPPTGHPDVANYWANTNTLSAMTAMAMNALEDWFDTIDIDLWAGDRKNLKTIGALAEYWSTEILGSKPDEAFMAALATGFGSPDDTLAEDQGGRDWQARTMIALVALSPEFMTR